MYCILYAELLTISLSCRFHLVGVCGDTMLMLRKEGHVDVTAVRADTIGDVIAMSRVGKLSFIYIFRCRLPTIS